MNAADRLALLQEARATGQLDLLEPRQRQAFELWAEHNIGYKRVGTILGCGRDAARGRVDRAVFRLKQRSAA